MNRTLIATLVTNALRRFGDGDAPTFDPAAARTELVQYGHSEDALKAMKDEDVKGLHGRVTAATQKSVETHTKVSAEKSKQEQAAAAKAVGEKWTKGEHKLELPEGSKLNQSDIDEIAAIARERGLSPDDAKAVLAEREKAYVTHESRAVETMKGERVKWVESVKADKELGGDNLAETQRLSMLAIERFATPTLREKLRETGFGDHPEIVRMWVQIGKAMSEDKPGVGGGLGKGGAGPTDAASKLYDHPDSKT